MNLKTPPSTKIVL